MHADLGEVKLQGVVGGQGDHEASGQILWQRVPVVAEEQAVIAERRHGDADLCQVVEILKHRSLWGEAVSHQRCSLDNTHTHTLSSLFGIVCRFIAGRVLPLLRSHLSEEQPVGDVL